MFTWLPKNDGEFLIFPSFFDVIICGRKYRDKGNLFTENVMAARTKRTSLLRLAKEDFAFSKGYNLARDSDVIECRVFVGIFSTFWK